MYGRQSLVCGICLAALWWGHPVTTRGDDQPLAKASPEARPVRNLERFSMSGIIAELQGDLPTALRAAGLRPTSDPNRFLPIQGFPREHMGDGPPPLTSMKLLTDHFDTTKIVQAPFRGLLIDSMRIRMSNAPSKIPYLVPTGTKSFELREFVSETNLGVNLDLQARAGDDAEHIELSPLKISVTTLDGREPIAGVSLDVGKPIVSTRTLETSATLKFKEPIAIAIPSPAGRQVILFLAAYRLPAEIPDRVLPNPVR